MFCLTRDNSPRNLCIMTLLILLCNEVNIISEEAFSRLLWFFWRIYLNCSLNPTMNSQFNYFVISRFFRWFYSSLVFMKHRKFSIKNNFTQLCDGYKTNNWKCVHTYCACILQLLNAEKKMNDVIMNKVWNWKQYTFKFISLYDKKLKIDCIFYLHLTWLCGSSKNFEKYPASLIELLA
jgi:hypothetical protein